MQKFWSILFGGTMLGALLLFVVAPFVGWWLPKNVATFGGGIDGLYYLILAITGFFFVLTEAILVIALWNYTIEFVPPIGNVYILKSLMGIENIIRSRLLVSRFTWSYPENKSKSNIS